ncbi:MAG: hypothetical protein ACOVKC_08800 [Brevundimonas sp.]
MIAKLAVDRRLSVPAARAAVALAVADAAPAVALAASASALTSEAFTDTARAFVWVTKAASAAIQASIVEINVAGAIDRAGAVGRAVMGVAGIR